MCYSAQVWAEYHKYLREYGAEIDIKEFARLYGFRQLDPRVKIPKGMDAAFADPKTEEERQIKALIDDFNRGRLKAWEEELFKQRRRLADAVRILGSKPTKKAENDQRIATNKVKQLIGWIEDVKRQEPQSRDSRIYPMHYAPVMIWENGRRVLTPMRYQCRLHGWPAKFDREYPGTYNARRDNLEKAWAKHFGVKHGLMVATAFYENVSRHRLEQRELRDGEAEENVVIKFEPKPWHDMLVACLWSDWSEPGEPPLLSFAAITDEPPAEVSAAGHDRCIIPIRRENIDAWLDPRGDLTAAYAILDDRERPYYEHRVDRMAA